MIDKKWLDADTANGNSTITLILGRGLSGLCSNTDWGLIPYAPPELLEKINKVRTKSNYWLVGLKDVDYDELDREPAVIAYAPAWHPVRRKADSMWTNLHNLNYANRDFFPEIAEAIKSSPCEWSPLSEALNSLDEILGEHIDINGELVSGVMSSEMIDGAERVVREEWKKLNT